jgi:hypothetical protein
MASHFGLSLNGYNAVLTINPKLNKYKEVHWSLSLASKDGNTCNTKDGYISIDLTDPSEPAPNTSILGYQSMLPIHPPNPATEQKLSKYVMVNAFKAFVVIDTVLLNKKKLSWSLWLINKNGYGTASTYGHITVIPNDAPVTASIANSITPVTPVTPVKEVSPNPSPLTATTPVVTGSDNIVIAPATTTSTTSVNTLSQTAVNEVKQYVEDRWKEVEFDTAEKLKHVNHLKQLLDNCEKAKGKENKAAVASEILTYLTDSAFEFTKFHTKFEKAVINKCYEFKSLNPEMVALNEKADLILTKLGASTTVPADYIPPVTNKKAEEKPLEKPLAEEKSYDPEFALFMATARTHNLKYILDDPEKYFKSYQKVFTYNRYKCLQTAAERMNVYFDIRDENKERINLMKQLFAKNNLVFSDLVMDFYNDWIKTFEYKGKGNVNRYIKMSEFVNANKAVFTAPVPDSDASKNVVITKVTQLIR